MSNMKMEASNSQAATRSEEWDEAKFEAALARLKETHIRLRNLRTTIPRMIQPFVTNHTSPEELYDDFSKAAVTAAKEVKDFRDYFQGDRYIFTHAVRSRKNSEGIIAWRVTDHPDWLDRDDGGQPEEEDDEIVDVEDGLEGGQGEQNVDSIVGAFTRSHPELKLQYNKDTENIKLYLPPAKIHFQIQHQTDQQGKASFQVTCEEKRYLHAAILQCIASRPRPHDLSYLLDMLASYADVTRRPCERCGKLLNGKPQLATGRRRVKKLTSEGQPAYSWEAYH